MTHLAFDKMEKNLSVAIPVVCLAILLFQASGRVENDVAKESRERHLFVQRDTPLPGSPKKLFKIEHGFPSRSSGGQNVHEVFHRVRRSLNPDMKPEATVVRTLCSC